MRTVGIILLVGIACFWIGRLTIKPETKTVEKIFKETTYIPPASLQAVCRSFYPCPPTARATWQDNITLNFQDTDSKKAGQ